MVQYLSVARVKYNVAVPLVSGTRLQHLSPGSVGHDLKLYNDLNITYRFWSWSVLPPPVPV